MNSDKFERFISNSFRNIGQSFYDSYVEANVSFRSKIGMKQVIIRRQLGNCCDWCANLAGIYDAFNAPDDIYRRHRNCRCLVTYKTEEGYQNVWNKKIYQTQRESRIERIKEISSNKNKFEKYEIRKRKLLSAKLHVYDATDEWKEKSQPNNVTIKEIKTLRIDGKRYDVDGSKVIQDLKPYEKLVLDKFVKKYGGLLEYCPRIIFPEGISTPDCLFNGIRYDLKTPGINKPGTTSKNALFSTMFRKKKQASCFIFDITRTGLTREEAEKQAIDLFTRKKSNFIKTAILYDGDFFKVIERI